MQSAPASRETLRPIGAVVALLALLQLARASVPAGHVLGERAFRFSRTDAGPAAAVEIRFDATNDSPLINPALVIRAWGDAPVSVARNGVRLNPDEFRVGCQPTPGGVDLVLWLRLNATSTEYVTILPSRP